MASAGALALDPDRALSQYVHDAWKEAGDSPFGSVTGIVQTKDGYLWLATQEGLVRFDGVRFVVSTPSNTPAMRTKFLVDLAMDREGALWMTSQGRGVMRKQGEKWTSFGTEDGLADEYVQDVIADKRGRLWFDTDRGLSRFEHGKFVGVAHPVEMRDKHVLPLLEDRHGDIWFKSEEGLYRWRDGAYTRYTKAEGLPHDEIESAHEDPQGRLWVGTRHGLAQWHDGRFVVHPIPGDPSRQTITAIHGDRDGNLWLGTAGGGLLRYRDGRIDAFKSEDSMSHVTVIFEDAENSLWIGTYGDGLHRLHDGKFRVYGRREGLSHDATYSASEDREGAVWIGTYGGGLNRLKDGKVTTYTAADGLRSEMLGSTYVDRNGDVWLGSLHGLHRLSSGKFRAYTREDGISDRLISSMLRDRSNQFWVGSTEGLHVMQGERFHTYTQRDGLPSDFVSTMVEGRDGSLWIGTYDGGLVQRKNGRFTVYRDQGLDHQPIACLYEDMHGVLWIGTFGGGLVRRKHGRFHAYTMRHGMFDDNVLSMLEDGHGRLWMSSNRGISRVDKRDLDAVASGIRARFLPAVYGKDDGMRSVEGNGSNCGSAKHRDGRLWFPTQEGVVVIDPDRLNINTRPPPVVIESLRANNRDIALRSGNNIAPTLVPGTTNLEIQYTGLSFVASKSIVFRYRLEGFEDEWVDAGTRRTAYYTNLEPGKYLFRVIARNGDGVWNEVGAKLAFSIEPRFYQTTWFVLLCATALLLGAWALHRVRLALAMAKVAVFEERNRIAQEIHDGLSQELGGIAMQLEAARERVETATDLEAASESIVHVQRARNLVESALEEQHRLIWALHPARLDDGDLAEAIGRLVAELDADGAATLTCRVGGTPVELARDLELVVLRIAQEAIFNSTRHGRASRVEVDLDYEPAALRLTVKDDGCGFDAQPDAAMRRGHFGLHGMLDRMRRLGGTLEVTSGIGAGTTICATFPRRSGFFRILDAITGRLSSERHRA